jgi:conjugal transfer mating pair stabilization protein TraN
MLLAELALASQESSYQQGGAFTSGLQQSAKDAVSNTHLEQIPGFTTAHPPEANLDKDGNFQEDIRSTLGRHESGQHLLETARTRQRFTIDPKTDPLFTQFDPNKAEELLAIESQPQPVGMTSPLEKTCEEGGEDIHLTCHENLKVTVINNSGQAYVQVRHPNLINRILTGSNIRPEELWGGRCYLPVHLWDQFFTIHGRIVNKDLAYFKTTVCPTLVAWGKLGIDCSSVQSYTTDHADNTCDTIVSGFRSTTFVGWLRLWINYSNARVSAEEWHDDCQGAESMVEEGLCQYGERVCSAGPETRTINGLPVHKDCWQYRQNYQCKMIKDECSALRAQGCYQTGSRCKELKEGRCWIYEQTYQCPNGKLAMAKVRSPVSQAFCLTGDCHATDYQVNGDMLEAISRLNVLKEVQEDIRGQGDFQIFKGQDNRCSRNCISFKDCCGGMKGWGVSLHLSSCEAEEKALAKKREKSLCYKIGTYCDKKVLGKCITKKTSFCCFGSKVSRLLQEQGRAQLGISWGEYKAPDCRGFTVEELSRMDLSKMDFREVFDDMMKKYKQPDAKNLQERAAQKIKENLQQIEAGLKKEVPSQKAGLMDGSKNEL